MAEFFAVTSKGLSDALFVELKKLNFKVTKKAQSGVFFEGSWQDCYLANLESRLATRIIKPVLSFPAYNGEELYHNILKHDFTKYIPVQKTISVEATVKDGMMHDQRFVAMKVKDAVVDQFREKFGERPNVDTKAADFKIYVRGYKNRFDIAIDTTGNSLFQRGYRSDGGVAPVKEHVAAALVDLSGWDVNTPLVDPFCGSGTILIEAALKKKNIAPGTLRKHFAFMDLNGFNEEAWDQALEQVIAKEKDTEETGPIQFFGFDNDRKAIDAAKKNIKNAGFESLISIKKHDVATLKNPIPEKVGMIVTNPPYGARVGELDLLKDTYKDFSHILKTEFKNWTAWLLSGDKDLILSLKLKNDLKHFLYNGPIECRFLRYQIR